MMLNLLEISLATGVPTSLRNIPDKYNIIIRLWTNGFYRLLENLRRSSLTSKIALEYLQEFIYYAYTFYTALLERNTFEDYRAGWLEALGDLARYRIVIAAMVPAPPHPSSALTIAALNGGFRTSPLESSITFSGAMSTTSSEKHPARPCSPTPSVGIVAARLMELEPEKDRWRGIARDWYAKVVAECPGRGKLHHHLGLLSREAEGEELRAVYHFVKR
jgi:protein SMG6